MGKAEVSSLITDLLVIISSLRNPLWMLVNTTIHGEVEMIVLTNKAMKDLLEELLLEHCSAHERRERI